MTTTVTAPAWRKSTHSAVGNCVEAATWRKASYSSSGTSGNCVEAGTGPGVVGVRDTQLGEGGPVLEVSPAAWTRFLGQLR